MTAAHRLAFADWLACAVRGAREPAAVAARAAGDGLLERVTAAARPGTCWTSTTPYAPGLAHLSAAIAPAALVLGAQRGATAGEVLAAPRRRLRGDGRARAGVSSGALRRRLASDRGLRRAGAAVAAARLLELDRAGERNAIALALLRAGGLRAAFGSDGKALQVGLAAAAGVHAALLAEAGASVDAAEVAGGAAGFAGAFGVATSAATLDAMLAAADAAASAPRAAPANWIKAYPCCLQTHAAIDAALAFGGWPEAAPARGLATARRRRRRRRRSRPRARRGARAGGRRRRARPRQRSRPAWRPRSRPAPGSSSPSTRCRARQRRSTPSATACRRSSRSRT